MSRAGAQVQKWTDDDLRTAVASQTSWKGVARALGLAPSGYQRVRRRARQLTLDTAHFKSKRHWSDYDLRAAATECSTWAELLERLDVSDSPEARLRIKGHALRLGIDMATFGERQAQSHQLSTAIRDVDLSRLRFAAESIASAWFTVRGMCVAVPAEPQPYDLIVALPEGLKRVQVKSSAYRGKQQTWKVEIGRRPYQLDKSAQKSPYDPDLIDYYFVVVGDGSLYFIPSGVVAGMTAINVGAYEKYRVGDASSLLTAAA